MCAARTLLVVQVCVLSYSRCINRFNNAESFQRFDRKDAFVFFRYQYSYGPDFCVFADVERHGFEVYQ